MQSIATIAGVSLTASGVLAAGPTTLNVSPVSSQADVSAEFFTFIGSETDAGLAAIGGQFVIEADDFTAPTTLTLHDFALAVQPAGALSLSGRVTHQPLGEGDFTERFDGLVFAAAGPIVAAGAGPFEILGVPVVVLGEATALYDIVGLDPVTVPRIIDTSLLPPGSADLTAITVSSDGQTVTMSATVTLDPFTVPFVADLIETRLTASIAVLASDARGCNPADIAEPFGQLDLADIGAFVSAFLNGDPAADIAPPVGTLDLADLSAFITAFTGGCP